MANVIIKSEERKAQEAAVMRSFGASASDKQAREYAACITARTNEAAQKLQRMEERK